MTDQERATIADALIRLRAHLAFADADADNADVEAAAVMLRPLITAADWQAAAERVMPKRRSS